LLELLVAVTLGVLGAGGVASAATFTVNDTTDAPLATPTATSCVSSHGGSCTLRAAVQAADNGGGASTITVPAGNYRITIPPSGSDDPSNGDLDINNGASLTVTGAGAASTTIDANLLDRAFNVQPGASLSLSAVTIENGFAESGGAGFGGAIDVAAQSTPSTAL
jgi:CSLREA domain-containing protein